MSEKRIVYFEKRAKRLSAKHIRGAWARRGALEYDRENGKKLRGTAHHLDSSGRGQGTATDELASVVALRAGEDRRGSRTGGL